MNVKFRWPGFIVFSIFASGLLSQAVNGQTLATDCSAPPSGLVGWWRGENNMFDATGGNNGQLTGSMSYGSGKVGNGFTFNGNNGSGISVGNPANLHLQNLTIEAWIKRSSATAITYDSLYHSAMIFGYGSGGYAFALYNQGQLLLGKTDYGAAVGSAVIADTNWHHVAVSQQGSQVIFYIDGVASTPYSYQDTYFFNTAAGIGSRQDILANGFLGTIDEVSVYNRALTASEIKSVYTAGSFGKCMPAPPAIMAQPASVTNVVGQSATLSVVASGTAPLGYQWRKDGVSIAGATSTNYVIAQLSANDIGTYTVAITNSYGSILSSNAFLGVLVPVSTNAVPAASGLVGWWRGEHTMKDEVGGNNGALAGTMSYGPGEVGSGFVFNGTNGSGISVGNSTNLQLQNLTIEAWIKRGSTAAITHDTLYHTAMIFGYGSGGYAFALYNSGNLLLGKTDYGAALGSAVIADTNWHHVAATQQGSQVIFYIDGVASTPYTYQDTYFFNTAAGIGSRQDILANAFWGTIDEVAVYNRVLTASEIKTIYNSGSLGKGMPAAPVIVAQPASLTKLAGDNAVFSVVASGSTLLNYQWKKEGVSIVGATNASINVTNISSSNGGTYAVVVANGYGSVQSSNAVLSVMVPSNSVPAPSGLVSWWRAEGTMVDEIGGNNGKLTGTMTYGPGKVGNGFVFNGTNGSGINVGTSANLQLQNLTIEAWIKRSSTTAITYDSLYHSAMIFGYGSGGYGFALYNQGQLLLGKTDYGAAIGSAIIADTNWHHVAVSQQGSQVIFYIDGVASVPYTYQNTYVFNTAAGIGSRQDILANEFLGTIDEVAVYNRALTSSEVNAIYNAGSAGKIAVPTPPVIVTQPVPQNGIVGQTVTFAIQASGKAPLSYQWYLNATNAILGATNPVLSLTNVKLADAGSYSAIVSNSVGVALSSNALLSISVPGASVPSGLIGWWRGEGNALDQAGTNSGIISGNVTYGLGKVGQGFVIDGQTGSEIVIGNPASLRLQSFTIETWVKRSNTNIVTYDTIYNSANLFGFGGGGYVLGLLNDGRYFLSKVFYDGVFGEGAITDTDFHHLAVSKSNNVVTFYLDGIASAPVSYGTEFEFTSSVSIGGTEGTGASFLGTLDEVSVYDRGLNASEIKAIYDSGSSGKGLSSPPVIVSQPVSHTNYVGDTVTFGVVASGAMPITYQWKKEGVSIVGATTASLSISNISLNDSGIYSVTITNGYGLTVSSNASLTVLVPTQTGTPAPSGLVGWWRGENNMRDQVGGNDGTLTGTMNYGPGEVGNGFIFNGYNGSGINVGNSASLQLQNLTIEAWIKRSSTTAITHDSLYHSAMIFGYGSGGYGFALYNDGELLLGKTDYGAAIGSAVIADTNWHHVAATQQGSQVVFYIDGVASTPYTYENTYVFTTAAGIGSRQDILANMFLGMIDEVSVYNRALTSQEIKAIYNAGTSGKSVLPISPTIVSQPESRTNRAGDSVAFSVTAFGSNPLQYQWHKDGFAINGATNATLVISNVSTNDAGSYSVSITNSSGGAVSTSALLTILAPSVQQCTPPPAGLVGWWRGESNALDQLGSNSGVISGNVTYGPGKVGQGFVFDGQSGSDIVIGNPVSLHIQDFSIETWMKRSSDSIVSYDSLYESANLVGFGDGGWVLGIHNDGSWYLSNVNVDGVYSDTPITDTQLHHIAVTKSNNVVVFYLDGVAAAPVTYDTLFTFGSNLAIGGCDGVGASFLGMLDEVAIYNRGLTAAEIKAIYDAGSAGKCAVPVPPVIVAQPISQTNIVGGNATFTVGVSGTPPMWFQWRKNGAVISGATSATLNLANVSTNDAGTYAVSVTNASGVALSSNAFLSVVVPANTNGVQAPAGLVSWWRGENNMVDEVGGNNGTLTGSMIYGPGEIGNGFVFDGTNGSGINVGTPTNLQLQNLTIEAWIKRSSTSAISYDSLYHSAMIFGYGSGGYNLGFDGVGHLEWGKTDYGGVFSSVAITDTNWHHIAASQQGSQVVFYIDGVASVPSSYLDTYFFTAAAGIGSRQDILANVFLGTIDEVSVYNRVLTPQEIKAVFDAGSQGKSVMPAAPRIYVQPVSQGTVLTGSARFSVVAAGSPTPQYQWYFNSTSIVVGGTNDILTISNITADAAGSYSVVVSNRLGVVTSSNAMLNIGVAPVITQQPQGLLVPAGSDVTLSVAASGTGPLAYQWQRGGLNVISATNSVLVISNFQQSGSDIYRVIVTSPFGAAISTNATVAILTPTIQVASVSTPCGSTVTIPVRLTATGIENAAGFNLQFNSSLLRFVEVEAPNGAETLIVNTNLVAAGKLGLAVALPPGTVYPVGTQDLVYVTFAVAPITYNQSTSIGFATTPITPKLVDAKANQIAVTYVQGTLQITLADFEGDVSPQPGGDHRLDVSDWVKVGRFVAGLDTISSPLEFQKVDCAPRSTLGNGIISVTDWVQAGRYAAGLDPTTAVGGPTQPVATNSLRASARLLGAGPSRNLTLAALAQEQGTNSIAVRLSAQGDENALAFSLSFDPTVLRFINAAPTALNGRLIVNTNQAGMGILGLALALPSGNTFGTGLQDLLKLDFSPVSYHSNSVSLTLIDGPVQRELSDVNAQSLAIQSADATIETSGLPLPAMTITQTSTNVTVSWPISAQDFVLQIRDSISTDWTNVAVVPTVTTNTVTVVVPSMGDQKFFRLERK